MSGSTAVIIPVYNRQTIWQRAAESVLRQSLPAARLILVDDGSTDKTRQNIEEWIATNKKAEAHKQIQIELVSQKNLGASHARNNGLETLRSYEDCDFVCFIDSDDEIPDDFISRTSQLLRSNQAAIAASVPRLSIYDEDIIFDDMHDFGYAPMQWTLYYGASILSCSMFRLSALPAKAFLESQQIGEDMLLVAQLQKIQNKRQEDHKTALNKFWLISPGQAAKFWRLSTTDEEQSMTLKNNPHKTLSVTLDAIKLRKMAVTICAPSPADYPYYHSILGDWYLLAHKVSCKVAHRRSHFFISKYLMLAVYHKTFAFLIWPRSLIRQPAR